MEILRRDTDENHPMPRLELCRRLEMQGIPCSPRTVTEDIYVLNDFGYEVVCCQIGHQRGYYVPNRTFTMAELKIMMDAVQAAGFITKDMTKELVDKIAHLGGSYRGELLRGNLVRFRTRKHSNGAVYDTVMLLEESLRKKRKASFCYFHLDENHTRIYQHEHRRYVVEPLALIYAEDYYYLLCYNTDPVKQGDTVRYRVDRMDDVSMENGQISKEAAACRKAESYTSRVFHMFGGEEKLLTIEFEDSLMDQVYDRFGEDIRIRRIGEHTCQANVRVEDSPTFRSWIYQFGEKMEVVDACKKIKDFTKEVL